MTSSPAPPMSNQSAKIVKTVFFALILDLLGKAYLETFCLISPELDITMVVLTQVSYPCYSIHHPSPPLPPPDRLLYIPRVL